jgi:hypothetical protein
VGEHGTAVWSSDAWLERATAWLDAQGVDRTGAVERVRVRPWATILRAPTAGGDVWMKAMSRETGFEAPLYELLARVAPDRVLTPLGVDVERAWLLLPDGGPALGERVSGPELVEALAQVLPRYGDLQRALAPHAADMLAMGVNDMRPEVMPERFEQALGALPSDLRERVAALRETVVEWCERLAGAPGPPSLDHNDLHPWNVLGEPASPRFYDWGDSVVAHPFASMLLGIGFVETDPGAPVVARLRDAYLEPFGDLAPHADLVETLEVACRVAKIARALTWVRAIGALGDDVDPEWERGPSEAMASLLDVSYLGRF